MSATDRLVRPIEERVPERDDPTWYVLGFACLLFVGFSVYVSLLYRSYWLTGADFGSYVHMFQTTLDGNGFLVQGKYTVRGPKSSYWGGHFTATLLAFLPLYALLPSAYTLIVAKAFVLAASVPMCWSLARSHIESDRLALLVTASYGLNPFLWSAWLFDFQEQILLPILVFAAYYTYSKRRYPAFLVFLALVLFTNEFTTVLIAGFLVALAIVAYRGGRLRSEAPVLGVSVGILVLARVVAAWAIARYSEASGLPTDVIAAPLQPFVEGSRVSIGQLVGIVLAHPGLIVDSVSVALFDKVVFLVLLFVPVLFVAVADEVTVFSLVPFLGFAWVFAGRDVYYTFGAHYPFYVLPFVYIGAIRVLSRVDTPLVGTSDADEPAGRASATDGGRLGIGEVWGSAYGVLSALFAVILVVNLAVGVGMGARKDAVPRIGEHTQTVSEAIETIPPNAEVLTQNDVFPHVAKRDDATFTANRTLYYRYQRTSGQPKPEYILLDTELETQHIEWSRPLRTIFGNQLGTTYGLSRYSNGVWVFKRGYNGPPRGINGSYEFTPQTYELSDLTRNDAIVIDGQLVGAGGDAGVYYWYGPGAMLPPGNYTASFRVNATSEGRKPVANLEVAVGATPQRIANRTVTNTDGLRNVSVNFSLDRVQPTVEFRAVRAGGAGRIAFENVTVSPRGPTAGGSNASAVRGPRGVRMLRGSRMSMQKRIFACGRKE